MEEVLVHFLTWCWDSIIFSDLLPKILTTLISVHFTGEIEELLADPIQQSQFAPLSDSLCWAILEVTSSGKIIR